MNKEFRMSWDDDDDNMRGWDPPSEDDMEDNGMSRGTQGVCPHVSFIVGLILCPTFWVHFTVPMCHPCVKEK